MEFSPCGSSAYTIRCPENTAGAGQSDRNVFSNLVILLFPEQEEHNARKRAFFVFMVLSEYRLGGNTGMHDVTFAVFGGEFNDSAAGESMGR